MRHQVPRRGVSLGEVLMAVALLALVFLALVQIFPTAYAAADQSADVVTAAQLGQAYMDREMNRNYDQLANRPMNVERLSGISAGASISRNFEVTVQVARLNSDRSRITVSVQWKQRSQDPPREFRLQSTRVRP